MSYNSFDLICFEHPLCSIYKRFFVEISIRIRMNNNHKQTDNTFDRQPSLGQQDQHLEHRKYKV